MGLLALRTALVDGSRSGWLLRRRQAPAEMLDFFIAFEPDEALAHRDGWNDGFIMGNELDAALRELEQNTFRYRGELLVVEWLVGDEAERLLTELRW